MNTDLVKPEWLDTPIQQRFVARNITEVIKWVTEQAVIIDPTVETREGRKLIASTALKVANSKVFIDDKGKDQVREIKEQAKQIDVQRKRVRDELDALKIAVREPLTNWENAEKERVQALEERVEEIVLQSIVEQEATSQDIAKLLAATSAIVIDTSFDEMIERACFAKARAVDDLKTRLGARIKWENDQEELQSLRLQAEQRARGDREEQIRKDAASKAKAMAEEAAHAKAQQDRLAIERAQAEKAAAEAREMRAIEQHEAELASIKSRQELAEKERILTIENEAEDQEYQAEIEREAIDDIEKHCLLCFGAAEEVFNAVSAGKIRHMQVKS